MSFIVIIPARYASTRLPAKPLRDIAGLSMIQRVWQQARKSNAAQVVIATDDSRIELAAQAFGAEVCMTRADHLAQNEQAGVATLCEPIEAVADFLNPNAVKVVTDNQGMACYFSRAPVPWPRDHFQSSQSSMPALDLARRHIGIYGYRVAQLNSFVSWPVAPLEQAESLEQLRFMWHGVGIHVADAIEPVPTGIDTEEDLQAIIELINNN